MPDGSFYFAYVEAGTVFDPSIHRVRDEDIYILEIDHNEGDFATLNIDVKNPKIGLLSHDPKLWCLLSEDVDGELILRFRGRLIAVPKDTTGNMIRIEFIARPDDFADQKTDLAETLKVLPYYDRAFIDTSSGTEDPNTVLEGYPRLWHIDRATLEVTASDILNGEDGIAEFVWHSYDDFSISYSNKPLKKTKVTVTASWTQTADGSIDVTRKLVQAFRDQGSPYSHPMVSSLTGDGLYTTWPKDGASMGAGWEVVNSMITKASSDTKDTDWSSTGTWAKPLTYKIKFYAKDLSTANDEISQDATRNIASFAFQTLYQFEVDFKLSLFTVSFGAKYTAARKRTEIVKFTVEADVQDIDGNSDTTETEEALDITSEFVGMAVDEGGAIPIGDLRRSSYFKTARGAQSVEYSLHRAVAKLLYRARCVSITFFTSWDEAVDLSLRMSAKIVDRRLPGGEATGKITNYKLSADAASGKHASITIGCCVGKGGSVSAEDGTPSYVSAGYVAKGYQVYTGKMVELIPGALTYQAFDGFDIEDDGVDFFNVSPESMVTGITVTGGFTEQTTAIQAATGTSLSGGDPLGALREVPTKVTVTLKSMTGEFSTIFEPEISKVKIPNTIDLSALEVA